MSCIFFSLFKIVQLVSEVKMLYDLKSLGPTSHHSITEIQHDCVCSRHSLFSLIWFISSEESVEFILGVSTSHDCSLGYYH